MRTDDFRRSSNVEDDREASASRGMPGGAGVGIGVVIVCTLVGWYLGIAPTVLLNGAQQILGGGSTEQSSPAPPVTAGTPDDPTGQFVAAILGDTEDRWTEIFAARRKTLPPAEIASVFRVGADALRLCPVSDGSILLPARPARLSRHGVL